MRYILHAHPPSAVYQTCLAGDKICWGKLLQNFCSFRHKRAVGGIESLPLSIIWAGVLGEARRWLGGGRGGGGGGTPGWWELGTSVMGGKDSSTPQFHRHPGYCPRPHVWSSVVTRHWEDGNKYSSCETHEGNPIWYSDISQILTLLMGSVRYFTHHS